MTSPEDLNHNPYGREILDGFERILGSSPWNSTMTHGKPDADGGRARGVEGRIGVHKAHVHEFEVPGHHDSGVILYEETSGGIIEHQISYDHLNKKLHIVILPPGPSDEELEQMYPGKSPEEIVEALDERDFEEIAQGLEGVFEEHDCGLHEGGIDDWEHLALLLRDLVPGDDDVQG